jgi:hypothetical protein
MVIVADEATRADSVWNFPFGVCINDSVKSPEKSSYSR